MEPIKKKKHRKVVKKLKYLNSRTIIKNKIIKENKKLKNINKKTRIRENRFNNLKIKIIFY